MSRLSSFVERNEGILADNKAIIGDIQVVVVSGIYLGIAIYIYSVVSAAFPTPTDANLSAASTLVTSNVAVAMRLLAIALLVIGAGVILTVLQGFTGRGGQA